MTCFSDSKFPREARVATHATNPILKSFLRKLFSSTTSFDSALPANFPLPTFDSPQLNSRSQILLSTYIFTLHSIHTTSDIIMSFTHNRGNSRRANPFTGRGGRAGGNAGRDTGRSGSK